MQIPAAPARTMPGNRSLAFLVLAFISGLAGALQTPTLSLFLTTEVQVRPFMVGRVPWRSSGAIMAYCGLRW